MTLPEFIIFDWDGTIHNSQHKIVTCLQLAAQRLQLRELSADEAKDVIGLSLLTAIAQLFPECDAKTHGLIKETYIDIFLHEDDTETPLFDDAAHTLTTLIERGHRLAIATGKARKGLDRALKETELGHLFKHTRCADETKSKPDPLMLHELLDESGFQVEQAIMIGDSIYDLQMAKNIEMSRIGVGYGVHDAARLQEFTNHEILTKLSDLV